MFGAWTKTKFVAANDEQVFEDAPPSCAVLSGLELAECEPRAALVSLACLGLACVRPPVGARCGAQRKVTEVVLASPNLDQHQGLRLSRPFTVSSSARRDLRWAWP